MMADPRMIRLAIGVGFVLFLATVLAVVLLADQSRRVRNRLGALKPVGPDEATGSAADERLGKLGGWLAKSPLVGGEERDKLIAVLNRAGLQGRDLVTRFIAVKTALVPVMPAAAWGALTFMHMFPSLLPLRGVVVLGAAIFGWRLPDMLVGRMAKKRQRMLKTGVADALDLMVICVESGLGLEQSVDRVSRDIAMSNPVIADEFRITLAEMRVLPQPRMALENFAKRSGLQTVRSVVTTLIQSLQYGTPLAQSLRILSAEMRTLRMLEVEERAARLPVLLTIPLIVFILPSLFFVIIGPAAINIMNAK